MLESIYFLGPMRKSYKEIWDFQKERVEEIARGEKSEALIFCEHESVITLGRRSHNENILDKSLPTYEIERGGDVTWHGPGQLVIYPLFRVQEIEGGLHGHLRLCEEAVIQTLQEFGLDAGRYGPTGVWVKRPDGQVKKIASIGVAVRRWVTYHGISLNVSTSASAFRSIRPCNFDSNIMTSLQEEDVPTTVPDLIPLLERNLRELRFPQKIQQFIGIKQ